MTKFKGYEVSILINLVKQEKERVKYSYFFKDYHKSLKLLLTKLNKL